MDENSNANRLSALGAGLKKAASSAWSRGWFQGLVVFMVLGLVFIAGVNFGEQHGSGFRGMGGGHLTEGRFSSRGSDRFYDSRSLFGQQGRLSNDIEDCRRYAPMTNGDQQKLMPDFVRGQQRLVPPTNSETTPTQTQPTQEIPTADQQ